MTASATLVQTVSSHDAIKSEAINFKRQPRFPEPRLPPSAWPLFDVECLYMHMYACLSGCARASGLRRVAPAPAPGVTEGVWESGQRLRARDGPRPCGGYICQRVEEE